VSKQKVCPCFLSSTLDCSSALSQRVYNFATYFQMWFQKDTNCQAQKKPRKYMGRGCINIHFKSLGNKVLSEKPPESWHSLYSWILENMDITDSIGGATQQEFLYTLGQTVWIFRQKKKKTFLCICSLQPKKAKHFIPCQRYQVQTCLRIPFSFW
jgi:hypothetical protein